MTARRKGGRYTPPGQRHPARSSADATETALADLGSLIRVIENVDDEDAADAYTRWVSEFPLVAANLRFAVGAKAGLTPIPDAPYGWFETRLRDGTAGYLQRRSDDCEQAAIATVLQIPPHHVPDLRLHEQLLRGGEVDEINRRAIERMDRWADELGVTLRRRPVLPHSGRWIGVVSAENAGFDSHCLVMTGRSVLFDPGLLVPGVSESKWGDIDYAITLER